jgi:hypothetical protein
MLASSVVICERMSTGIASFGAGWSACDRFDSAGAFCPSLHPIGHFYLALTVPDYSPILSIVSNSTTPYLNRSTSIKLV